MTGALPIRPYALKVPSPPIRAVSWKLRLLTLGLEGACRSTQYRLIMEVLLKLVML
jgi:hypothetical protein